MNKGEIKILDTFKPFINAAQAFVDEHIVGNTTMTVKEITEGFMSPNWQAGRYHRFIGGSLTHSEFDKGFRLAIREGLITGLEAAQKKGYKRAGVILPRAVTISPEDWDTICFRLHLENRSGLPEVLAALAAVAPLIEAALNSVAGLSALHQRE
jgi:hypothetical protein